MVIRVEAEKCPKRREQQRKRDHRRDDPGRYIQLDDHHPVERAVEQCEGHAHRHLEQREPQQPSQRQIRARGISERQEARVLCPAGQAHGSVAHVLVAEFLVVESSELALAGDGWRRASRSL